MTTPCLPPVDSCDRKPKHHTGGQSSIGDITPDDHALIKWIVMVVVASLPMGAAVTLT